MNGRIFGYARVSTEKQDCESQITQLKNSYPHIIIFSEIASTRKVQTELKNLLRNLSSGDTLVVTELSRLARNFGILVALGNQLKTGNITLISIKEGIDTSNELVGPLMFHLLACFYEFERDLVKDRTIKALETKRKRGLNGGRPRTSQAKLTKALQDYHKGDMTVKEILKTYHIGRSTLYKYINLKHQQDSKN